MKSERIDLFYSFDMVKTGLANGGFTPTIRIVDSKSSSRLASNQHDLLLMPKVDYINLLKKITKNYKVVTIGAGKSSDVQFIYPTEEDCLLAIKAIKKYINENIYYTINNNFIFINHKNYNNDFQSIPYKIYLKLVKQ